MNEVGFRESKFPDTLFVARSGSDFNDWSGKRHPKDHRGLLAKGSIPVAKYQLVSMGVLKNKVEYETNEQLGYVEEDKHE